MTQVIVTTIKWLPKQCNKVFEDRHLIQIIIRWGEEEILPAIDKVNIILPPYRQQPDYHLQSISRSQQIHHYLINTRKQFHRTPNLSHNITQHYQASTQNQFQNPVVSQQQSHNNLQIPWQNHAQNPQTTLQMQQPYMQNQQVPIIHTQGALTWNLMHTNLTADQSCFIPTPPKKIMKWAKMFQWTNIIVKPIWQKAFEQAQFRTPHFQKTKKLQKPANTYGQPVAQTTHVENQSPYTAHLPNTAAWAE